VIKKRKKILIACDSSRTLIGFRGKLMEALVLNNDVSVFTPKINQENIKKQLLSMGISIYENDLDGSNVSIFSDVNYAYQLYKLIKKIKPDVFFPYTFKPVIYGVLIANFCKVNKIVPMLTGLGYHFSDQSKNKSLVKFITRKLLKWSLKSKKNIRLILQNKDDYQTLLDKKIIDKAHNIVIVNGSGVDLSFYDFSHLNLEETSFLMIARLINAKGIKDYFDAATIIKQNYPDVKFKLIGPKDHNIDAIDEALYQQIVVGKIIEYIGEVDDVRPHINACSVVVLPSYYGEGIPRCLLEGMAIGRAIITSNSVGCKETITIDKENQNGFLIPIKNPKILAKKMQYFINNPSNLITFGKNSRLYAQKKFDVNLINILMLDAIEN
jgi:glycosyltransferase involved in cell wall biosynthesis